MSAAPAVFEDGIYAASEDGGVYAMAANRDPLWTIDGGVFKTSGGIVADVKVDEFGVYVASTATVDRVYQWVTGKGIVAINKIEGKTSREPVWVAPGTRHFLSEDESNVYVLSGDQSITALDKVDGQPRFRSRRHDIHISTVNHSSSTIYVATRRGEVLAVKPVLQAGTVGQVVMNRELQMRDAVAQSK